MFNEENFSTVKFGLLVSVILYMLSLLIRYMINNPSFISYTLWNIFLILIGSFVAYFTFWTIGNISLDIIKYIMEKRA